MGRTGSGERRWFSTGAESDVAADLDDRRVHAGHGDGGHGRGHGGGGPGTGQAALSQQYALARGAAVKLGVRQAGWVHVDAATLTAAGMPAYVSPLTLRLFVHGEEQALQVVQQAGVVRAIEFYGTGVDTAWSDTQV